MENKLNSIIESFEGNLGKVETLLTFDRFLQEFCLIGLRKAKKGLDSFGNQNDRFSVDNTISQIEQIRGNASMKMNYEIMHNQCIVLMVSYFSSVLEDIFKEAFRAILNSGNLGKLESEEFKITVGQLHSGDIAEVFIQKKNDISFQDMQSTIRSFRDYIGISQIERGEVVDNIILAQAMRHCIVHDGCVINNKTVRQLQNADKRTVKPDIEKDQHVQFAEKEVRQIKEDMLTFVNLLSKTVLKVCPSDCQ